MTRPDINPSNPKRHFKIQDSLFVTNALMQVQNVLLRNIDTINKMKKKM